MSEQVATTARAGRLLRRAMALFNTDRQRAWQHLTDAATLLTAETVASELSDAGGLQISGSGGLAGWQVRRVLSFIEERLASNLTVGELACLVGLSHSHFSRRFRRTLGCSPKAFFAAKRVDRAKRMMSLTRDPLCEIALACGFSDQSHFNRAFRRWNGMSPGNWRRRSSLPERNRQPGQDSTLQGKSNSVRDPQTGDAPLAILTTVPLEYEAAVDHRKATTFAISPGDPARHCGEADNQVT